MAVIDEHWRMVRETIRDELLTDGERTTAGGYIHHVVCDWGMRGGDAPNDEDAKLLASVPELLRKIRDLEHQLEVARDG